MAQLSGIPCKLTRLQSIRHLYNSCQRKDVFQVWRGYQVWFSWYLSTRCWRTSALTDTNTYAEVIYASRPTTTSNRGYHTCRT